MKKIRTGVVGVGYFGQFHAEKYANMEGVDLVGVADVDPSRVREVAHQNQTRPFFNHSELLDKVQAVSIAVPTPFHHAITKDFLLRGIDVLLEKPITRTLEEADELIELAESKGLIFQVGHLERFNGAFSALEGIVHHPLFIESYRTGPFTGRGAEVHVVLDLMVHDIDILLSLVNSQVKQIHAIGIPFLTHHSDMAHARIEFENGCTANLTANRVSNEKIRKTRIFQSERILSLDYLTQRVFSSTKAVPPGREGPPELVTEEVPVGKVDLLEAEIHSFVRSVRERKQAGVSGQDGKRALALALQIVRKAETFSGNKG